MRNFGLSFSVFFIVSAANAADPVLPDFTQLVELAKPPVVNISTTQQVSVNLPVDPRQGSDALPEDHPFSDLLERFIENAEGDSEIQEFDAASLGSGFIISTDGEVLTNYHVIRGADEIIVRLADRRELPATVIGIDPPTDIALLKIDATDLPVVNIGNVASLKVGEWVLAIGSPFGFDHSVTKGIVSAKGRSVGMERYVPFIQTDVAINPGNSGGPLFNMRGEVVGINSQIYSRTGGFMGVSFAIPIDLAIDVAKQLKATGRVSRGWLGVNIQDVSRGLAESIGMERPEGALVRNVFADSPAADAGIEVGDIIVAFGGLLIHDANELPPMVGRQAIGAPVPVSIRRGEQEQLLSVTLIDLNNEAEKSDAPAVVTESLLGFTARALESEELVQAGISGGVIVAQVSSEPATSVGIQVGDIIISIDDQRVSDLVSLRRLVEALPPNRPVQVLIKRGGTTIFLPLRRAE
ncbi:MAG: Do family serine endopeptidase [Gammaproteobacteria bacterium]